VKTGSLGPEPRGTLFFLKNFLVQEGCHTITDEAKSWTALIPKKAKSKGNIPEGAPKGPFLGGYKFGGGDRDSQRLQNQREPKKTLKERR